MRDKQQLADRGVIDKDYHDIGPLFTAHGIYTRDFNDVQRCDAIFSNLTRAKKVSIGSLFEIAWAWQMRKPIVIVRDSAGLHDHPFLVAACPYIVDTVGEGVAILSSILKEGQ